MSPALSHPTLLHNLSKQAITFLILLGLSVSSLIGIVGYHEMLPLYFVKNLFYDTFMKYQATGKVSEQVIVVDVDDESLSAVGQWPWPRYKVADLIQTIADMKPAAIGLDILFAEPDRTSLATIQQNYKDDFGLDISFDGVPAGLTDNDGYLGSVMGQTGVVGASYFYFDHVNKSEISKKPTLQINGQLELLDLHDATAVLFNTHRIDVQLQFSGFINNQADADGMLRRMSLLIQHKGDIYPSLVLATLMRSLEAYSAEITNGTYGPVVKVGPYAIPITKDGFAYLRFTTLSHILNTLSAIDLLNGSVGKAEIEGKMVFVGSSAVGLNDFIPTVLDSMFPGVQTHSVLTGNILNSEFIIRPVWTNSAILTACVVTGSLMSIMFIFSSGPLLLFLGTIGLVIGILLGCTILFLSSSVFLSPGYPILVAVNLFALFSVAIEKRATYQWYRHLVNAQQVTIQSMATVAETRDPETGEHIKRTQHYVKAIAEDLLKSGQHSDVLSQEYINLLYLSAPLHDIGKVGVPDNILLKEGRLTEDEFDRMKKHTVCGQEIIANTVTKIQGDNFLAISGEIAVSLHEKWYGSGYPLGLSGEKIPLSGRIMAVADVYDALTSRRCYKPPFTHEKARAILLDGKGTFFDPAVLDAFLAIEETITEIASRLKDE